MCSSSKAVLVTAHQLISFLCDRQGSLCRLPFSRRDDDIGIRAIFQAFLHNFHQPEGTSHHQRSHALVTTFKYLVSLASLHVEGASFGGGSYQKFCLCIVSEMCAIIRLVHPFPFIRLRSAPHDTRYEVGHVTVVVITPSCHHQQRPAGLCCHSHSHYHCHCHADPQPHSSSNPQPHSSSNHG